MHEDLFAVTQNALARARELRDEAIELRLGLLDVRSPAAGLDELVEAVVRLARADRGHLQVFDPESGTLRIVAQMGFDDSFLDFFAEVDSRRSASGVAFATREPVVVEDVSRSAVFSDPEARHVTLEADSRAVESAPLVGASGDLFGAVSVHYAEPLVATRYFAGRLAPIALAIAPRVEAALADRGVPGVSSRAVVWID